MANGTDQGVPDSQALSVSHLLGSTPDFAQARSLKRELLAQQQAAWHEGAPIPPEELLARWPGDAHADPDVASLLFEDYRNRREHGKTPSVQEYENRFPEHAASLARLHAQHAVLQSLGGSSERSGALLSLPQVGDEVFGFRPRRICPGLFGRTGQPGRQTGSPENLGD
jgi:hypothetical protein